MGLEKRGFFHLEWKKLILPLILVLLLGYQVFVLFSAARVMDNSICTLVSYSNRMETLRQNGNQDLLNKTALELLPKIQGYHQELERIYAGQSILSISKTIDPLFPFPCGSNLNNYCGDYINESTFNCINSQSPDFLVISLFGKPEKISYSPVSIFSIIINFLGVFMVGYLISAILLFIFRKFQRKKEPEMYPPQQKSL